MRLSRLCFALAASLAASSAFAITSDEVNAGIQFNFANPGARALGMGGAFLGLADDATAGNGHDTLFLAQRVLPGGRVFAFDVQEAAIGRTRERLSDRGLESVTLIHAGHQEIEQRPQLGEVVLDRGAGEAHAVAGVDADYGIARLRRRVLDRV